MKNETGCWLTVAGALTVTLMLGVQAQAGSAEDTVTVTEAVQRSKMQAPCPDRRTAFERCVTRSRVVAHGDLDLGSQAGAKKLYARLRSAAKTLCGANDARYVQYVGVQLESAQCVERTLDHAVVESGIEQMLSIHHEATGRKAPATSQLAGTR